MEKVLFRSHLKQLCIIILIALCLTELGVILFMKIYSFDREFVDISNTTCSVSEHLGRRIFFHICAKDVDHLVYDLRYFWRQEKEQYLKPERIGVQLIPEEFRKVCHFC